MKLFLALGFAVLRCTAQANNNEMNLRGHAPTVVDGPVTVADDTHFVTADGPEGFAGDVENLQGGLKNVSRL